jgi:hypothetical protein
LPTGFLGADDALCFHINIRNPSYPSLVRDQQKYIEVLRGRLEEGENPAQQLRTEKMNELVQESSERKQEMVSFLFGRREEERESEES